MVPGAGLEPARPYGQGILSPKRLPFRHPGARLRPSLAVTGLSVNSLLGARDGGCAFPLYSSSSDRHRYQLATDRYGCQRRACFKMASGVGSLRFL
jgi:hypothetical protein